tara:strand:+ start:413 stop:673 length:261 start_codon:yes stop_codon:yes gene_type:complete
MPTAKQIKQQYGEYLSLRDKRARKMTVKELRIELLIHDFVAPKSYLKAQLVESLMQFDIEILQNGNVNWVERYCRSQGLTYYPQHR